MQKVACDDKISKLSEEKLSKILDEVRKLHSSTRITKRIDVDHEHIPEDDDGSSKKEVVYVNS
jgi:hypothetical protein